MPACDPLHSIVALICIALHGNRPIPYSHYPGEIQLGLQRGERLSVFLNVLPLSAARPRPSRLQPPIRVTGYKDDTGSGKQRRQGARGMRAAKATRLSITLTANS